MLLNILTMIVVLILIASAIDMFYYPKTVPSDLRFQHAMSRLGWSADLVLLIPYNIELSMLSTILFIPLTIYGLHTDALVSRAQARRTISRRDQLLFHNKKEVQATPDSNYSNIYALIHKQCQQAKVKTPKIYIKLDNYINGTTILRHKPYKITITTSAISTMSPDLLRALTAHEVGHLRQPHKSEPFFIKHNILAILLCIIISIGTAVTYALMPNMIFKALGLLAWVALYTGLLVAPALLYARRKEYDADDESVKLTSLEDAIALLRHNEIIYPSLKHLDSIVHPSNTERIKNIKHYAKKHHLN